MGLYTGLVALALLMVAYFALTRLIVRPVEQLSSAARRVAHGARKLEVPDRAPRELGELGSSLRTMTEKLLGGGEEREEAALRQKIEEVERAQQRLADAQERLIRSERLASVGRLAAGLAHEIGNPLAAISGMQDLLLSGELEEEQRKDFLSRMQKETDRINRIIKDLLQFARPGKSQDPNTPHEPGNVETAVYDTVALLTHQKTMQDIELSVDIFPELPRVELGHQQLMQVVLNLVINARDACAGSGTIKISAEPSVLGVELSVTDNGSGISKEAREHLFEPFFTTKEVGAGTGLGLAVCQGLIEAAGGHIHHDESHKEGARFVVDLLASGAERGS